MQRVERMSEGRLESVGQRWPRFGPFVLSQLKMCICHQTEPRPCYVSRVSGLAECTHPS